MYWVNWWNFGCGFRLWATHWDHPEVGRGCETACYIHTRCANKEKVWFCVSSKLCVCLSLCRNPVWDWTDWSKIKVNAAQLRHFQLCFLSLGQCCCLRLNKTVFQTFPFPVASCSITDNTVHTVHQDTPPKYIATLWFMSRWNSPLFCIVEAEYLNFPFPVVILTTFAFSLSLTPH